MNNEGLPRPDRVMIVDDEIDYDLWEFAARTTPASVTVSSGGLLALKKLEKFNYNLDAIVIDLSMPDKDGLSLTKEIREQEDLRQKEHPIKVFWCTGMDVPGDETLAHAFEVYRVTEVLRKPITPDEIMRRVYQHIS